MTRIIGVTSGKGGVGKTTTAVNLGAALTALGRSVILVDANLTTPNVGIHLGVLPSVSLHDVLQGDAYITEAIAIHPPTGLRVVPAGLSVQNITKANYNLLDDAIAELLGYSDFVIVDSPAGLEEGSRRVIEACDEVIIVTNPRLPDVTDALRARKIAEYAASHVLGVVLNKYRGLKHELTPAEVEQMLEAPVIVQIPEDDKVYEAVGVKNPVVNYAPACPASNEWNRLAHLIAGLEYTERVPEDIPTLKRFIRRLLGK